MMRARNSRTATIIAKIARTRASIALSTRRVIASATINVARLLPPMFYIRTS